MSELFLCKHDGCKEPMLIGFGYCAEHALIEFEDRAEQ